MNSSKHINLFLPQTEYHFLQSINLSTSLFSSDKFINKIYLVKNKIRFKDLSKDSELIHNNIQIYIFDEIESKALANKILAQKIDHFFIFQAISFLNVFLGHKLSQRGVEVSLGQDGYIAYCIFNKKNPLLTLIKNSFYQNYNLLKNKLYLNKIFLFDYYKYGNYNFITNLWLSHPDQYIHVSKNKVNIKKLPFYNEACLQIICKFFSCNFNSPTYDSVYYFNQPLWTKEMVSEEFKFLRATLEHFKEKKVYLKLHPLTPVTTIKLYQQLSNLEIIELKAPAEILLIKLKNCIVFSGWSTVLMTENKNCNYYFNYPIYKNCGGKAVDQSEMIILNHINEITHPEKMKFPNE